MSHSGKMTVEKARRLRDEERGQQRMPLDDPHPGSRKQREIRFDHARPEQVAQARELLAVLERLTVREGHTPHILTVEYEIHDYTLQGLETALVRQGFHLEHSVYAQLSRAVIYFCEETQLRNLQQPERLLKQSHEIYSKAWEHHPHGDHDDTPPELRSEK
ncbi:conserved protein of unknown function [Denitratisoma oestradiolicum]|uniref:Uncharacterized protein n=2 Tax=Denitratisoma oestradiolicum TaxID=311182 RepID=A0A6S6XTU1_9PROT|nr:conserved protein of unknown function [Denitratisoma oestradiolicum]